jgi:GT2 family glycosyltransferase
VSPNTSPVTAIVTAYDRIERTLQTIRIIQDCNPRPDEILVHVDASRLDCHASIQRAFPELPVILSPTCVGPGGARNRLIRQSKNELVASFDDDSFPVDCDYFARTVTLFDQFPEAAIICATVFRCDEPITADDTGEFWVADFCGGACIYRRSVFLATAGYVPLPIAYGMEEIDLALQLHALGARVLRTGRLRVRHDTAEEHHADPAITSAIIANIFLLAYLRYPASRWWVVPAQVWNRILFLIRKRRLRGIAAGFYGARSYIRKYTSYRQTIPGKALDSYFRLRKHPIVATVPFSNLELDEEAASAR